MKFVVPNLKLRQKVWAVVEEVLSESELIASFSGDLIKVKNESKKKFKVGDRVQLIVVSVAPLSFQIVPIQTGGRFHKNLDLSV